MPTPPAAREISAHWRRESKIPSMLSSLHVSKKHEASCCRGQPALNIVGVACVKRPRARAALVSEQVGALQRAQTEVVKVEIALVPQ